MVRILLICYAVHPDIHSFPTRRSSDLSDRPKRLRQLRPPPKQVAHRESHSRPPCPVRDEIFRGEFLASNRARPSPRSDRKSTRLNSSHDSISYAVFCLKKKNSDS